jgi:hypothetical protein
VTELDEMGPIDYLLVEWQRPEPSGEIASLVVDLVDRGIIRVLDLAFVTKDADGSVAAVPVSDLAAKIDGLNALEGASSGLLDDEDIAEAGASLEPGAVGALLVFENRWAAPFATAVRRSGGQLVANGRIPVQAIVAALDAAEAADAEIAKS